MKTRKFLIVFLGVLLMTSEVVAEGWTFYNKYADLYVRSNTIHKVVPSPNGQVLYFFSKDNPTEVFVWNHWNGTNYSVYAPAAMGDIDITDDGYLVGVQWLSASVYGSTSMILYKWNNVNGVANGSPVAYNVGATHALGNFTNGAVGRLMCFNGTSSSGYMHYTAENTTTGKDQLRWVAVPMTNGSFGTAVHNNQNDALPTSGIPKFLDAWSNGHQCIINWPDRYIRYISYNNTEDATVIGYSDGVPTEAVASSYTAYYTPGFWYGGQFYIIAPAGVTSLAISNVNGGIVNGYKMTATIPALGVSSFSGRNNWCQAVAVPINGGTDLAIFLVRDGHVSKWVNLDVPGQPTISSASTYWSGTTAKGKIVWNATANANSYRVQQWNGSEWVDYTTTTGTSIDVNMPATSWTVRVYAINRSGETSSVSNQVTLTYAPAPTLTAGTAYYSDATPIGIFSWTKPANAASFDVQYLNGSTWTDVASITSTSFEYPISTSSWFLKMRVRAKTSAGLASPWSNEATVTAVGTPTLSGSATMGSDGDAHGVFTWTAPTNATAYDIQHKVNGVYQTYDSSVSSTTLDEAIPDQETQTWTIQVRARGGSNCVSPWSNEVTVTYVGYDRVFVGSTSTDWNTASNWQPAHVPTIKHDVLIKKACTVSGVGAAKSINLRKGAGYEGVALTIAPTGSLTVEGTIRQVTDDAWGAARTVHTSSDLIVKSDATGQGVLAQFDTEGQTPATVEVYGMYANGDGRWTFVAMPFDIPNAQASFYGAWMMHWVENQNTWTYVTSSESLPTFKGYLLTQTTPHAYSLRGILPPAGTQTISGLTYNEFAADPANPHDNGSHLLGNSWTAPLQIGKFNTNDFVNVEPTIYIYDYQEPLSGAPVGYYKTASIGTTKVDFNVINPLQGFFVVATAPDASVRLDYEQLVDNKQQLSLNAYRAPQAEMEPAVEMLLRVTGDDALYCDLRLLQQAQFTHDFDAGYDGRKLQDESAIPYLAAASTAGDMAILATPAYDGTFLNFRKGNASSYTISFVYDGADKYLLEDAVASEAIEIRSGNTYTFTSSDDDSYRFRIVRVQQVPDTATDMPNVWANNGTLYLTNPMNVRTNVCVYSTDGKLIEQVVTRESTLRLQVPSTGVYVIQLRSELGTQVIKHILQ